MSEEMQKEEFYTTKEVALKLGKSIPTIYKYVQEKKLVPREDHVWRMQRGLLFPKEQIEFFLENQKEKIGLTINEAAEQLRITRTTLARFISEGELPIEKAEWRGKEVSFIKEEDLIAFSERQRNYLEQERIKKRDFYDKEQNIAFYQKFSSSTVDEARLIWGESERWQFLIPLTQESISFNEGIYKHDLQPEYELTYGTHVTTPGYAKVALPRHYPLTGKFIDLLYKQSEIAKFYMDFDSALWDKTTEIIIIMKDTIFYQVQDNMAQFIEKHLVDGSVVFSEGRMAIHSAEESFTLHMPKHLKQKVKKQAVEQKTSMQEIVNNILEEYYRSTF